MENRVVSRASLHTHHTIFRITITLPLLAALVLATSSCAPGDDSADAAVTSTRDEAFDSAFIAAWQQGGSRKVADLTRFRWDGLRVFAEGAPAELVNSYVGSEVVTGQFYDSSRNLFVFTEAGKPVRLARMSSDFLSRESYGKTFGPNVRLTVDQPGAGLGRLEE
jgi:hypothetical protein